MPIPIVTGWPDTFDFDTDQVCQKLFKPFIKEELASLRAYDDERPDEKNYIFHQHAARVAKDVKKTCLHIGLSEIVANNMYWATLPHDIGKRLLPIEMWDSEEKPSGALKKVRRTHTLLGVQIVSELFGDITHPFKALMVDIMAHHHEQLNGGGTLGLNSDKLSKPVRLAAIVEAYDGYRIWRPHFGDRDITPPAVIERMREEKGADIYDLDLLEAFAQMKINEYNTIKNFEDQTK
jgi:HD-GYP domain-containing protein (c-di-GMP phosphodiesterase class II)